MLKCIEINPKVQPQASVILLHGLGADADDLLPVAEQLQLETNLAVRYVIPNAPKRAITFANSAVMRAWFDLQDLSATGSEDVKGIQASAQLITSLIAAEAQRNIPSNKIVLAGFSQGGAMALHCGLRYPERLGGVVVLSAWLPLANTLEQERNLVNSKMPILQMHGTLDTMVSIVWAEHSRDFLKKHGYNVSWQAYAMQHTIIDEEITTIARWLEKI
jgi:phospholipase/carboxylesterase